MSAVFYWYGPSGYHGGDQQQGDISVPMRPDETYDWNGTAWVQNAQRAAAAAQAATQATAAAAALQAALLDPTVQFLITNTPAACYAQVQTMVIDLPSAKDMMGRFAMVLSVVAKTLAGK